MNRKRRPLRRTLGVAAGMALILPVALTTCGGGGITPMDPESGSPASILLPLEPDEGTSASEAEGGLESALAARSLVIPSGTRVDKQGAVEVAVTPLGKQSTEAGRLVFEVAMNTHSVDLSMDLRRPANLTTDTGLQLPAVAWSGRSGHYVTGWLEFEFPEADEAERLITADLCRLEIRKLDAEVRAFEWEARTSR